MCQCDFNQIGPGAVSELRSNSSVDLHDSCCSSSEVWRVLQVILGGRGWSHIGNEWCSVEVGHRTQPCPKVEVSGVEASGVEARMGIYWGCGHRTSHGPEVA